MVGFSLVIIFAALPVALQWLYVGLASAEYRNVASYMALVGDALEGDFGAVGAFRTFPYPGVYYGSFGVSVVPYRVVLPCGVVLTNYTLFVFYNATYLVGQQALYRGLNDTVYTHPNDTMVLLQARPTGLWMYVRPSVVAGKDVVIYAVNVTRRFGSGGAFSYRVVGVVSREFPNCRGEIRIEAPYGRPGKPLSSSRNVYVVWTVVEVRP